MATIAELIKAAPKPVLKECEKCGFSYYFFHDCKKSLEKEKTPVDKLKDKFNGEKKGKRK